MEEEISVAGLLHSALVLYSTKPGRFAKVRVCIPSHQNRRVKWFGMDTNFCKRATLDCAENWSRRMKQITHSDIRVREHVCLVALDSSSETKYS